MSFFPAKAVLTSLVGSLGAEGTEREGWEHTQEVPPNNFFGGKMTARWWLG